MLTVCAIVLDYFGYDKTVTCLSSLRDQGLDTVLVVYNSGDATANQKLDEALQGFMQKEPSFHLHRLINRRNLGFAKGVNGALRWLEKNHPHRFYLLMNNDAEAAPGMVKELLRYAEDHPGTRLLAPIIMTETHPVEYLWYQRLSGLLIFKPFSGFFPFLSGCCLLVDRRLLRDGLFDEDFFMYGEDVELGWRLRREKIEFTCVQTAKVLHEVTGSSRQGELFYEYYMVLGHLLLARKLSRHSWEIPLLLAGRFLALSLRAAVRVFRFRSLNPAKAFLRAWYNYVKKQDPHNR